MSREKQKTLEQLMQNQSFRQQAELLVQYEEDILIFQNADKELSIVLAEIDYTIHMWDTEKKLREIRLAVDNLVAEVKLEIKEIDSYLTISAT